jgi:hypothetical protein
MCIDVSPFISTTYCAIAAQLSRLMGARGLLLHPEFQEPKWNTKQPVANSKLEIVKCADIQVKVVGKKKSSWYHNFKKKKKKKKTYCKAEKPRWCLNKK